MYIHFWTTRRESRRKIEGRAEKGEKHWLRWGEERPWVRGERTMVERTWVRVE